MLQLFTPIKEKKIKFLCEIFLGYFTIIYSILLEFDNRRFGCSGGGTWGPIRGNWTNPAIWGVWTRFGCSGTSTFGFKTFCREGGGGW